MATPRFRQPLLNGIAQCLMRLVETRTATAAVDALVGFLEELPITWHTLEVFGADSSRKRVASRRCPRGFAAFVVRLGFVKRLDGTYQGTFADSTLLLVKAGGSHPGGQSLVCAIGFPKNSPLNDGVVIACVGALIHEVLSRVLWYESDAVRAAALETCSDSDDVCAVFDAEGHLVEQHPAGDHVTLPPALFEMATARSGSPRSKSVQPVMISNNGCDYDVRSRWVTADRVLDNRYLLVRARARTTSPIAVVERLRGYSLSRRESQVAELVFSGTTNQRIADALFISRDTVKTHCRHIFSKLGISRRTEFLRVMGDAAPNAES